MLSVSAKCTEARLSTAMALSDSLFFHDDKNFKAGLGVGQQGGNSGLRRSFRALDAPQHFKAIFASSLPLTTTMSGSSSPVIVNTNRPCQL